MAHPKTPVPAPAAGKFSKVFVAPGGRVLAGQRLLTLVGKTAVVVVAPVAGTFTAAVPLGKVMKKGDVVGHVANASAWQLTAHLDAPPAGRNCRVVIVGNDAPCAVVSVDPDLVVSVDAAAAPWLSASTVGIEIELSP